MTRTLWAYIRARIVFALATRFGREAQRASARLEALNQARAETEERLGVKQ